MVLVFDAKFDVTSSLGFSDSFYFILVLCVDRRRENQSAGADVSFLCILLYCLSEWFSTHYQTIHTRNRYRDIFKLIEFMEVG